LSDRKNRTRLSNPLVPYADMVSKLSRLHEELSARISDFKRSLELDEHAGLSAPSDETKEHFHQMQILRRSFSAKLRKLEKISGIPPEIFQALEDEELPVLEDRYWRKDVITTPITGDLDKLASTGLDKLLSLTDLDWLKEEAKKSYRLEYSSPQSQLHIVGGIRVPESTPRPQRFARMLLVCADHLNKESDLDFFEAPLFVSEVAALGTRLSELKELGREADQKLLRLPQTTDDEVATIVYELLVGTAGIRKGLELEMLAANRRSKTPDFRLHNFGLPSSIECKRRLGLSQYEDQESAHIRNLYEAIRPAIADSHVMIEASFSEEIRAVDESSFVAGVSALLTGRRDRREARLDWGHISVETLNYIVDFDRTRLFSPDFLSRVFGWMPDEGKWDGISCEVDTADATLIRRAKNPRCLKWVSRNSNGLIKKSRGVTSLWGKATQQIPAGNLGFIYICYPEINRSELADARTRAILDACQRWTSRWTVQIGATTINRLYPRASRMGMPDLIESAIPLVQRGSEHLLGRLPLCVFVPPPERRSDRIKARRKKKT
jgi:hypothetical protein